MLRRSDSSAWASWARPMAAQPACEAGHSLVVHSRSPEPVEALAEAGAETAQSAARGRRARRRRDHDAARLAGTWRPSCSGTTAYWPARRERATLLDRHEHDPPDGVGRDRAGGRRARRRRCWTRRSAAATSAPRRGHAVDHGRRRRRGLRARAPAVRGARQDDRARRRAGAGQVVKACNQVVVARHDRGGQRGARARLEGGVDPAQILDVLGGGLAGNQVMEMRRRNFLEHDFTPGFRIDLHHKDLKIALETRRRLRRAAAGHRLVAAAAWRAARHGHGGEGPLRAAVASSRSSPTTGSAAPPRPPEERPVPRMNPMEAVVRVLEDEGVKASSASRARRSCRSTTRCATRASATSASATRRAARTLPTAGRASPASRASHRHLRPRRHEHDHRPVHRAGRLDPDHLHHRAGEHRRPAQGGLPGGRHRRHRQARVQVGYQVKETAQLPWAFREAFRIARGAGPGRC